MKKKNISLIVVVLLLAIAVIIITNAKKDTPIPYSQIRFVKDESYKGSYSITRSNLGQSWEEYNEWDTLFLQNTRVCFGYFPKGNIAVFRSDSAHHWVETKYQGRSCLKLEKIQN